MVEATEVLLEIMEEGSKWPSEKVVGVGARRVQIPFEEVRVQLEP